MLIVAGVPQIQVMLFGTFWTFFPQNILDLQLVDSINMEPINAESTAKDGQWYICLKAFTDSHTTKEY